MIDWGFWFHVVYWVGLMFLGVVTLGVYVYLRDSRDEEDS